VKSILLKLMFAFLLLAGANSHAGNLPPLSGLSITGDVLSWDAEDDAVGYNVYLDYSYYDTVTGSNNYTVTEPGQYRVVWFNDAGEYSPVGGQDGNGGYIQGVEYTGETGDNVNYDFQWNTLLVYKTCTNVGPGETCIATCPTSYEHQYGTAYPRYLSGGACSTSDIVEADAFVSYKSYRCTVPTFSGEVVAQAICIINN